MHTHHEDHVEHLGVSEHDIGVSLRIDSNRCARAEAANLLCDRGNIGTYLAVDGDRIGARLHEALDVLLGLGDHEMRVERQLRDLAQRFHHREADRNVGHEMPVHYVEVDQIGARLLDAAHLLAQAREVGGKNRRRKLIGNFHVASVSADEPSCERDQLFGLSCASSIASSSW